MEIINNEKVKLNEMQKMAVVSDSRNILVTAGAGSGKTKVLTERILNLVNCKYVHPENILAITFTNKASNVMKERLAQKGLFVNRLWISTFHSSCVRILRENASFLDGYNSNFTIYDETDKNKLITQILKENKCESDGFKKTLSFFISKFKNKYQTLEEFKEKNFFEADIDDICHFIEIYEDKMKENNAFDFDDLLFKCYKLLVTNNDVLSHYQKKFKYILVDEFQDTNEIQYDFVKILSKNANVFVVGDEDQCIYSWRGANYKNISNFTKDFDNVEIIKLEQNYRSTKKIIASANQIISKNKQRIEKKLWTDNDEGIKIEYKKCYDEREEADYVVSQIFNLQNINGYKLRDMAILLRLNSLTRNFEDKLLNYGLSYKVYDGMKFYERLEIKNVMAYLKAINNFKDDVSFSKIANFPKRNIGETSLVALKNINPSFSMLENLFSLSLDSSCDIKGATLTKLLSLKILFEDLIENSKKMSVSEFVQYLVDKLNLKSVFSIEEEDKDRYLNIEQLILSIKEFEKNNENCSLSTYLQSVTLISDIDSYNEEDDCVTLATIHASKGLEFKCVFIVGLEEGIFPLIRQDDDCDEEEERRLMYVAVTRAMERLYLTCAKTRYLYGYTRHQRVSQYVKDLDFEKPIEYQRKENEGFEFNHKKTTTPIKSATEIEMKSASEDKDFKMGDKVNHPKFGDGIVLSISGDTIKIVFAGIGTKELLLSYAPIKKI